MLAIEVRFLADRYTATTFNDRNVPEWPPHPARLVSAMVATWADTDEPDPGERSVLAWLEEQNPPSIVCEAEPLRRDVVTHYVPDNDPTALTRDASSTYHRLGEAQLAHQQAEQTGDARTVAKTRRQLERMTDKAKADSASVGSPTGRETLAMARAATELLPELRGRQPRTYPTVRLTTPVVRFTWLSAAPTDEQRQALDGLLGRVARLGHSSTFVACRVVPDEGVSVEEPGVQMLVPGRAGPILRVPRTGMIDRLERAFAQHRGEEPRTLPAAAVGYGPPLSAHARPPRPVLAGDWVMLGLPRRPALRVTRTLDLTRAVRGALLRHGPQPPPELLTGHLSGPAPSQPSERPHVALFPLANAGSPYSDGTIHGVAVALPTDASAKERDVVEAALAAWGDANGFEVRLRGRSGTQLRLLLESPTIEPSPDGRSSSRQPPWLAAERSPKSLGPRLVSTSRWRWCRPSQRWISVTPVALDRFPGDLSAVNPSRREAAYAEAQAAVERACTHIGLPDPVNIAIHLDVPLAGVPRPGPWAGRRSSGSSGRPRGGAAFPTFRAGTSNQARVGVHVEVEFAEPVEGPVVLGAGRYFGYGLCLPVDGRNDDER